MKLLILLLPFSLMANDVCRHLISLGQDGDGKLINLYKEDPTLFEFKELISADKDKGGYVEAYQDSIYKTNTTLFSRCQKNSTLSWEKMHSDNSQDNWKLSWAIKLESVIATIQESYTQCMQSGDTQALSESITKAKTILTDHYRFVRQCEALRQLTLFSDYDDVELNTAKKKMSSDGAITCEKSNALTQDWKGCVALIDTYDASQVALQAVVTGHKISLSFKNTDVGQDNYKGAIQAQIDVLEAQKEHSTLLMGSYTAQAGALTTAMAAMPKMSKIIETCEENFQNTPSDEEYLKLMKTVDPNFKLSFESELSSVAEGTICSSTVQKGNLYLLQNDQARDNAKQLALQMGLKAGEQIAVSFLVGKNIDKLKSMLKGVDQFKPEDLNYTLADLVAEECQVNPGSENCTNGQAYLESRGFASSSININSSSANYGGANQAPNNDVAMTGSSDNPSGEYGGKIAPIGGTKHTNNSFNAPSRANVKSSKSSLGGGSGGASAGRMAAPGSSGSRNASGNSKSRYQSGSYAYKGKTAMNYRGGQGKGKKKSTGIFKKFTNLFKSKSSVTNFQDQSGASKAQGRQLFEIISNRYHLVKKSQRLMEYVQE